MSNDDTKEVEFEVPSREELLTKIPPRLERVELQGGSVYVRDMYGDEREEFEKSTTEVVTKNGVQTVVPKTDYFKSKVVVMCTCDKDGTLIFQEGDYDLVSANMKAADIEVIFKKAAEMNRFGAFTEEDEKN